MRGADAPVRLALLAALLVATAAAAAGRERRRPAPAEDLPRVRTLVNLTRGIRFDPPLTAIAVAPSDPSVVYVGTGPGLIHVSRDGGRTWLESRIRVPKGKFFGSIRPGSVPAVGGMTIPAGRRTREPSDVFGLGELVPDEDREDFGFPDPAGLITQTFDEGLTGVMGPGWAGATRAAGAGGPGGPGSRLGVGLRAGAPYLTRALRKKRGWAVGINLKQTLALKAVPPTAVIWLDVNPEDPRDVFAATQDGLLRTTNGGDSWATVLTGATPWERIMNHVIRNPRDPREVYVATGKGLMISRDGGETFARPPDALAAQANCWWVELHPTDPQIIFLGTAGGLLRSRDGGKTYEITFVSPWPKQNQIWRVIVDPAKPDRVLMGTGDGLFVSEDGGDTFERGGGLLFTGSTIPILVGSGRPGHFLAATWRDLWETLDGGKSWRAVLFGATEWTLKDVRFDPRKPDDLWILTYAEVLRYEARPPERMPPEALARYREITRAEPSSSEAVAAALRRAGVSIGEHMAARARARWMGLVPTVRGGAVLRDVSAAAARISFLDQGRPAPGEPLPDPGFLIDGDFPLFGWEVVGTWDLGALVFTQEEAPIDRYFGTVRHAEWRIRATVIDLYLERRRLQLERLVSPPASARAELMLALRMEELTAHLNALTGGLFAPAPAW